MSDLLDIRLIIDDRCSKMNVLITSNERNDDVEGLIAAIEAYANKKRPMIPAYLKDSPVMVPQGKIIRVYISNRRVLIQTDAEIYDARKTLGELEGILDEERFVRISQSEIINIRKVKNFDFSLTGTIGVELENGENTFVARRRVRNVKKVLERGGSNGFKN